MTRLAAVVLLALSLVLGLAASALPQAGGADDIRANDIRANDIRANDIRAKLDGMDTSLKNIATGLKKDSDSNQLQALRAQVDPIGDSLQDLTARLAPRLDVLKDKVDSYGPAPSDQAKAAGEPPATSEGRKTAQKAYGDVEAVFRRAKVLEDEAARLQRVIGARRRAAFTRALFERAPSLFEAGLWTKVITEWPDDVSAMRYLVIDSYDVATQRVTAWETGALAALLAFVAVLFVPARRLARRFVTRDRHATDVARLTRAFAAIRIAFATAAVPIAAAGVLVAAGSAFDLYDPRIRPVILAIFAGVRQIAAAVGIARAVLAPTRPTWRLIPIGDAIAKRLRGAAVTMVAINALFKIVEAFNDGVAASLPVAVATRAVGTLLIAAVAAITLVRIERVRAAAASDAGPSEVAEVRRHWFGLLNIAGWSVVILTVAAACSGYVAFAGFLVDQTIGIAGIAAILYVLIVLASDGVPRALAPGALAGRFLLNAIGVQKEALGQLSVLASGVLKVAFICLAALLVLAPWGLQSEDLLDYLRGAFFGFRVGGLLVSPASIAIAIGLFVLAMLATRSVRRWLETKYLPQTRLAHGLQNSILTSIGYVGFIVATTVALSYLGLSFEKFAIVAGALSVGIGFGLQSIVSNFVSGLIILWERAIQVGDWIAIGGEQGYVRRITVRSTEIETFERATLILPNSSLVTGTVKNWVRGNKMGRVNLSVGIDYAADPQQAHDILLECAMAHARVLAVPPPFVFFTGFGDAAMTFELYAYVDDVEKTGRVKSDLHFALFRALRDAGIEIPYTQSEARIRREAARGNDTAARA